MSNNLSNRDKVIVGVALAGMLLVPLMFVGSLVVAFGVLVVQGVREDSKPKPPMTVAAYKAQRPKDGARLTGNCEICQNEKGLIGIWIHDLEGHAMLQCYAQRDSEVARKLLSALGDGKKHTLTLEVRQEREGELTDAGNNTIILKVVDKPPVEKQKKEKEAKREPQRTNERRPYVWLPVDGMPGVEEKVYLDGK